MKLLPPLLLIVICTSPFLEVSAAERPQFVPAVAVSTCQLAGTPVELFWREAKKDARGKTVETFKPIATVSPLGGSQTQIPLASDQTLYARAEGSPTESYKPYLKLPSVNDGDRLLLLIYAGKDGRLVSKFLDASEKVHPSGAIRVANLSDQRIALSIGGPSTAVAPDSVSLLGTATPQNGFLRYSFATTLPDGRVYAPPQRVIRIFGDQSRILFVYGYAKSMVDESGREVDDPKAANVKIQYIPKLLTVMDSAKPLPRMKADVATPPQAEENSTPNSTVES